MRLTKMLTSASNILWNRHDAARQMVERLYRYDPETMLYQPRGGAWGVTKETMESLIQDVVTKETR